MIDSADSSLAPPPPPAAGGQGNPWERRASLGYGAGLLESIKLFIVSPSAAYEQTLKRGDFLSPLLFAVIVGWFGAILGQIWQFFFQGSLLNLIPPDVRDQVVPFLSTTPIELVISMILTPIFLVIGLFIWSLLFHLSLLLVGALGVSESGFEGTFRVNGYAYVVQLAAVVPFIGWIIGLVWFVALQTIGAARIHDTTPGRAFVGAVLPLFVCCVCFGLIAVMFGALVASAFQSG